MTRVDPAPDFLASERYKVQFTATAEYVRLVDEAKALLSHTVPQITLQELHLRALHALVSELTKKKYASNEATLPSEPHTRNPRSKPTVAVARELTAAREPRSTSTSTQDARIVPPHPRQRGRYIPAAVRRAVFERDGIQCTYIADTGERCAETHRLEFHHVVPFATGGEHEVLNLTLRCAAHNALAAEQDFGREVVEQRRSSSGHEHAAAVREELSQLCLTGRTAGCILVRCSCPVP